MQFLIPRGLKLSQKPDNNLHKKTTEFLDIILKQLQNGKMELLEKEKIFKEYIEKQKKEYYMREKKRIKEENLKD